jgi:hypothetical protein
VATHRSFGGSTRFASSSSVSAKLETWQDIPLVECQEILATAQAAARAAGEIILENLGCYSEIENQFEIKYSIKDVVTEYDKNDQTAIEDIVRAKYS